MMAFTSLYSLSAASRRSSSVALPLRNLALLDSRPKHLRKVGMLVSKYMMMSMSGLEIDTPKLYVLDAVNDAIQNWSLLW